MQPTRLLLRQPFTRQRKHRSMFSWTRQDQFCRDWLDTPKKSRGSYMQHSVIQSIQCLEARDILRYYTIRFVIPSALSYGLALTLKIISETVRNCCHAPSSPLSSHGATAETKRQQLGCWGYLGSHKNFDNHRNQVRLENPSNFVP